MYIKLPNRCSLIFDTEPPFKRINGIKFTNYFFNLIIAQFSYYNSIKTVYIFLIHKS